MTEHVKPIAALGKRLREEAKGVGLTMAQYALHPDLDGDHNQVVAVFMLDEEQPVVVAQKTVDPEFDKMMREQKQAEEDAKARQAREDLQALQDELKNPRKGLGLDD